MGKLYKNECRHPCTFQGERAPDADTPVETGGRATQDEASSGAYLREKFRQTGVSGQALDILMAAWKDGTQAQYQGYLKQWRSFCMGRDIDMFTPQVSEVLDFLTTLFDKGLGYSALNTARSSLSSVINIEGRPVGEHQIVVKFMKGVFNLRPSKPRTNYTWDPQIVLDYLKTLSPVKDIDYKLLTYKAVTLLWILSGQRG